MPSRILVIDDSTTTVALLVQAMTAAGLDATAAIDLSALNAELSKATPDLVLIDLNMPEMYGDDVIEFLRVQKQLPSKILLYSDTPERELAERAKRVGADGCVSKAVGLEGAIAAVRKTLNLKAPATDAPPPEPAPAKPAPAAPAAARKRRVLVVDDSEMTAKLLEAELTAKGFDVTTADAVDKATKIILKKQTRPDLVLLDVRMPNVNGEQFCRFIKNNPLFSGIKVLLCSGEDVEELQRICREAGADGYLPKDAVLSKVLAKEFGA